MRVQKRTEVLTTVVAGTRLGAKLSSTRQDRYPDRLRPSRRRMWAQPQAGVVVTAHRHHRFRRRHLAPLRTKRSGSSAPEVMRFQKLSAQLKQLEKHSAAGRRGRPAGPLPAPWLTRQESIRRVTVRWQSPEQASEAVVVLEEVDAPDPRLTMCLHEYKEEGASHSGSAMDDRSLERPVRRRRSSWKSSIVV